ncbi:MAG: hypothetical protein KDC46_09715 [Thermoleophilia bacterium]|nr:hypothetical protein [Thermoleophilia bacterium]
MSLISSNNDLAAYDSARRTAALTGATRPTSPVTEPAPQVTAATAQASSGAAQVQDAANAKPDAEPFNAPMLKLPLEPNTRDVMAALVGAMGDPTVNSSTANQLFQLHEQLMQAEKAMTQVIVDGMLI